MEVPKKRGGFGLGIHYNDLTYEDLWWDVMYLDTCEVNMWCEIRWKKLSITTQVTTVGLYFSGMNITTPVQIDMKRSTVVLKQSTPFTNDAYSTLSTNSLTNQALKFTPSTAGTFDQVV